MLRGIAMCQMSQAVFRNLCAPLAPSRGRVPLLERKCVNARPSVKGPRTGDRVRAAAPRHATDAIDAFWRSPGVLSVSDKSHAFHVHNAYRIRPEEVRRSVRIRAAPIARTATSARATTSSRCVSKARSLHTGRAFAVEQDDLVTNGNGRYKLRTHVSAHGAINPQNTQFPAVSARDAIAVAPAPVALPSP